MVGNVALFGGLGLPELLILLMCPALAITIAVVIYIFRKHNARGYKNCPHCAEKIKEAAIVCRFCGRDVIKV